MNNEIKIKKDEAVKKTIIKYNIDNTVEIIFPITYSDDLIEKKVIPKLQAWLDRKLKYIDNNQILFQGEYFNYSKDIKLKDSFVIDYDNKTIYSKYNPIFVFKDLPRLYNLLGNKILLEKLENTVNKLLNDNKINKGIKLSYKLKYRKTALGMCEKKGKNEYVISLNPILILAPQESIESVIYHEIAHITEMNHSKNFYRILYSFINETDYKIHQNWFKKLPVVTDIFK